LNDRLVPFYDAHEKKLCPALTDCGVEYCGDPEQQEYELYLPVDDVSIAADSAAEVKGHRFSKWFLLGERPEVVDA
jgi:hypothetical protein